jgi:predicted amino acid dehydrogenase
MAEAEGCSVVGLGGYCSIITRNGRDLWRDGPALTTGNAYTVAVGLEALCQAATQVGIRLKSAHAAVVGASGNIGSLFAELLLDQVARLTLVGRKSRLAALETQAGFLIGQILREGAETPIGQALEPSRRRLVGPEAGQDSGLGQDPRACYLEAREMLGSRCPIRVAGPEGLRDEARVIVAASSSPVAVIRPEHLPGGPVLINDLAVPSDVDPRVLDDPDVRVIRGGTVRTPRDPDWTVPGIPLEPGEMYACMTETVLMGLDGVQEHGTIGSVTRARVRETLEMARRHGFGSVRPTEARSY